MVEQHRRCPGSLVAPIEWVDWFTSELRPVTSENININVLHQCPRCRMRQYPTTEGVMPTHVYKL
jgi:hypothetical protein